MSADPAGADGTQNTPPKPPESSQSAPTRPPLGYPTTSPTSPSTGLTERHSTNLLALMNHRKKYKIPLDITPIIPHNTHTPTQMGS